MSGKEAILGIEDRRAEVGLHRRLRSMRLNIADRHDNDEELLPHSRVPREDHGALPTRDREQDPSGSVGVLEQAAG